MNEAFAIRLENGDDLLALLHLELGDQFTAGGGITAGDKKLVGILGNLRDGMNDPALKPPLVVAKPVEAAEKHGEGGSRRYDGDQDEKEKVIGSELGNGSK